MRRFIAVTLTAVLASAVTCIAYASAPKGGIVKQAQILHPPFKKVWTFTSDDQFDNFVVGSDAVYYGNSNGFGAVSIKSGKRIWHHPRPKNYCNSYVLYDGKKLYVNAGKSYIAAVNPKTGKTLWSLPLRVYSGPMTLQNGMLFCEFKEGAISAINTTSHKLQWTTVLQTRDSKKRSYDDIGSSCKLLYFNGNLYVGTYNGDICKLGAKRGKIIWRNQLKDPKKQIAVTGITTDGKKLYYTTENNELFALDLSSGKELWHYAGGYSEDYGCSEPLLQGNLVLFSGPDGTIYAVNAADGKLRWSDVLSRMENPSVSAPVDRDGDIIIAADSRIIAYDTSGKRLWEWDTEEDISDYPAHITSSSMLLANYKELYKFEVGEPPKPPASASEKLKLAQELVSRFEKLSKDEKRMLVKLGDEAFDAAFPLLQARLTAYERSVDVLKHEGDQKKYEAFSNVAELIRCVADKKHTAKLMTLLQNAKAPDTRIAILRILACNGDESLTIPLFLNILKAQKPDEECSGSEFDVALEAIASSSDPRAVEYLRQQLADPDAYTQVRGTAFINLADTGGEEAVKDILAARDNVRTIPTVSKFMKLEQLAATIKPKTDDYEWTWSFPAKLLDTHKDQKGILWGLIQSRAGGGQNDLWIASSAEGHWSTPIFSGVSEKVINKVNWFGKFVGNSSLQKDSDSDGWTDLFEQRIGTNHDKIDTDSDGLKDSEDKNPLAAPRELNETEQILASAFQARFQFGTGREAVCLVELPDGIEPLELMGWDWIVIPQKAGQKSRLNQFIGNGVGTVSFRMPTADFEGNAVRSRDNKQFILFNAARTEAILQLCTHFGGLDGTGYDIRLRKIGDIWVVIGMRMAWIS